MISQTHSSFSCLFWVRTHPTPLDNAIASKSVCLTPTIKQQSLTDIFVWEIHEFRFLVVCLKSIRVQWINILRNIANKSLGNACVLQDHYSKISHINLFFKYKFFLQIFLPFVLDIKTFDYTYFTWLDTQVIQTLYSITYVISLLLTWLINFARVCWNNDGKSNIYPLIKHQIII